MRTRNAASHSSNACLNAEPAASGTPPHPKRATLLVAAALALATALAYAGTLRVPFLFDDDSSIPDNPSIRQLWPPGAMFDPPPNLTVSGRPLLNVSFALNYAVSGTAVWSYHVANILIHIACGLLAFCTLRRLLPRIRPEFTSQRATTLAGLAAALWLLHPLQTESVTYLVQRAESLMACFYLGTMYAFLRATAPDSPPRPATRWLGASVAACLLGMASKEVMVSAPLLVLLLDRTAVAGSFAAAWRARRGYYVALGCTWLMLLALAAGTGGRGGTAGFDAGVSPLHYGLTQLHAVALYLKLSFWPHPLVFDYGTWLVTDWREVLLPGSLVLGLAGAGVVAILRRHPAGIAASWFFALLAPSSSVVPIATQSIAEHRMYLPLLAVVVCTVLAVDRVLGARSRWVLAAAALVLGGLTVTRNRTYVDEAALWADTIAKRPENARAHYNLAVVHAERGELGAALAAYAEAIARDPFYVEAHNNRAVLLDRQGEHARAREHYTIAARIDPANPEIRNNLGYALARVGRDAEAIVQYRAALAQRPEYPEAHNNLGEAVARTGDAALAAEHFQTALRLRPDYLAARNNLGAAWLQLGRLEEAIRELERAVAAAPDFLDARVNLGIARMRNEQLAEAEQEFAGVLRLSPGDRSALLNLGHLALRQRRIDDAIRFFAELTRLHPTDAPARANLGFALLHADRRTEAASELERAVALAPDSPEAWFWLGLAYGQLERWAEARHAFESALRLRPGYAEARSALERLQSFLAR